MRKLAFVLCILLTVGLFSGFTMTVPDEWIARDSEFSLPAPAPDLDPGISIEVESGENKKQRVIVPGLEEDAVIDIPIQPKTKENVIVTIPVDPEETKEDGVLDLPFSQEGVTGGKSQYMIIGRDGSVIRNAVQDVVTIAPLS